MPSKSLYKETMSPGRTVGVARANSSKRFGMLHADILARADIKPSTKVLYAAILMESFGSGGIRKSMGLLALRTGLSRSYVFEGLKELESVGLIEKHGPPIDQVQPWKIARAAVDTLPVTTETLRRKPELRPCVLCKDPCVPRKRTGWCARCTAEARNRQITRTMVREEVEKATA